MTSKTDPFPNTKPTMPLGERTKDSLKNRVLSQQSRSPSVDLMELDWSGAEVGTLIDETYRIKGTIGQGGMGLVVLAEDERLLRDVAIKFILPSKMTDPKMRRHFLSEARAMARVRHENVAEIYAFGETDDVPYIVMEYISDNTMADWLLKALEDDSPPAIDEVIGFLDQLCRGVSAIHGSGAIHGDLKPNNALIGPAFRVAIVDMGMARILGANESYRKQQLAGTPAYMAPEFVNQKPMPDLLHRADIYALGVMAFEMFTLESPFQVETIRDLILMYDTLTPPRPSEIRPDLPVAFDEVLINALQIDPQKRTPTVDQFRKQLLAARETLPRSYRKVRILVADDDPDFLRLATETLSFGLPDVELESVTDGKAAVDMVDEKPISLSVIDLDMPGMNGVEFTAMVRGSETTRQMPIVIVTASGGAPDWTILSSLGASGFLVKPIDPFALIALVRKILEECGL